MYVPTVVPGILFLLLIALPTQCLAAKEIEPNNRPEQATLVDPGQPIEGSIRDQTDIYKIILPESGPVEVQLEGYPRGSHITLGASGFRESEVAPLTERQGGEASTLRLRFAARERAGYIWVKVSFVDTICQEGWCAARLTENGPWYTTTPSPLAPAEWQGQPVLDPPEYQLHILQAGAAGGETSGRQDIAGYTSYSDPMTGLFFEHPPSWKVMQGGDPISYRITPPEHVLPANLEINLDLRQRSEYPGSSAELQLNLVERDLDARGAKPRKRGTLELQGRSAPYLVVLLPGNDGKSLAEMVTVIAFADHYCRVSYIAPAKHYADGVGIYENLLKSLQLKPPADSGGLENQPLRE